MRRCLTACAALGLLALPAGAAAHVTVQPAELPAGAFVRLDVRVPNERDDAGTTRVVVQLPEGFASLRSEPVPGWSVSVKRETLDEPVPDGDGGQLTEQIDTVTFTGDGEQGIIGPDEFQDFGISLRMPDAPGETLTFKALQIYEDGEVVRWIGEPDSDEPAAQVTLLAAEEAADDGDDGLAVVALIVGALGLLAGVGALLTARRGRSAA